jgi:hypothetical protein
MTQLYFVARGQSLKLPNRDIKWVADPRSGRRIKTGTSTGFLRSGQQLPADLVDWLKSNKDTTGQTKLQTLIDGGAVVFNQGDSSPIDVAPVMPVERTLTMPGERRS